jgi:predicted transposase YbfD/YdcC
MSPKLATTIAEHFGELEDPRVERTRQHELLDILLIALCGVICGAESWVEIELFGESKLSWLQSFLELPNGIPSHDTFGRVFARLNPEQFQRCFVAWVEALREATGRELVSVDGKTLRGSQGGSLAGVLGRHAIHMVSAWAGSNRLVLGQVQVAEKSNEITAIPELLALLALDDCIVTIDAMGCQTAIAEQIVAQGADYVLALKGNQGTLAQDVQDVFALAQATHWREAAHDFYETIEKDHGRIEIRRCWTLFEPEQIHYLNPQGAWTGLRCVAMFQTERRVGDQITQDTRYYLSSLSGQAQELARAVRGHWGIENSLHWVLDMVFREDASRVRTDFAPQNFAVLRHIALNLLKRATTVKGSLKSKRLKAGWDEAVLLQILTGAH